MIRAKALTLILCAAALAITACERKGPVERAGEKMDHVIDTVKNGGEEPTADKIQEDIDRAREKAAELADKANGR